MEPDAGADANSFVYAEPMNTRELRASAFEEYQELQRQVASLQARLQAVSQLLAALDEYESTTTPVGSDDAVRQGETPSYQKIRRNSANFRPLFRSTKAPTPVLAPQTRALRRAVVEVMQSQPNRTWTVEKIMADLVDRQVVDLEGRVAPDATIRKVLRQLIAEDAVLRVQIDGRTNGYRLQAEPENASAPGATGAEDTEETSSASSREGRSTDHGSVPLRDQGGMAQ